MAGGDRLASEAVVQQLNVADPDLPLALLALREQVIAPILAGVRSPRLGRKPATWTPVDRNYGQLRVDMQTLFDYHGIATPTPQQALAA